MRDGAVTKDYYILAAVAIILFAVWQVLRPAKNTTETTSQFESTLGAGQPVLLELQSPFWFACAAAKPIVDGIEDEFAGQLTVVRVDVQSPAGAAVARDYGAFTPTFVLFDAQGLELWRMIGSLEADQVRETMAYLEP